MDNINQLLMQAQAAYDAYDWLSLSQYLQQLILGENSKHLDIYKNREHLLELSLAVLKKGDFQQRWDIFKVFKYFDIIVILPMIDILENEDIDEELQWYAVQILRELKKPDAVAPLVQLIKKGENEELRIMAASVLGQMGTQAITALTELLAHKETKLLAVQSLSFIRQPGIIPPLLSVVQDSHVAVRAVAVEALSSFHDDRVPPVLLNVLNDVSATVRREAVLGLGFRPDLCSELDLVKRLQSKLYDLDEDVCYAAVTALSRMRCDAVAEQLFQLLMSPHTPIKLQLEAIRGMSWVETLSGLEYLQQAFHQLELLPLLLEIVKVLGRVQSPDNTCKATEILLEILQSQHPGVEIATVKSVIALSLGHLGNQQAVEPLTAMLADPDDSVRLHAITALKNLEDLKSC
ncbi:MAG: HEAT repeat domain-containing protein [Rhizonema sp. PD38]|nr:HEAT repeat domain-containing protein [Rhizonema sp. PD38]